jgi:hypothetical protein
MQIAIKQRASDQLQGWRAIAENRSEWRSRMYSKPMPPSENWSYRVQKSKGEHFISQKDTQPSQTCSGGFVNLQLFANCWCFFLQLRSIIWSCVVHMTQIEVRKLRNSWLTALDFLNSDRSSHFSLLEAGLMTSCNGHFPAATLRGAKFFWLQAFLMRASRSKETIISLLAKDSPYAPKYSCLILSTIH